MFISQQAKQWFKSEDHSKSQEVSMFFFVLPFSKQTQKKKFTLQSLFDLPKLFCLRQQKKSDTLKSKG